MESGIGSSTTTFLSLRPYPVRSKKRLRVRSSQVSRFSGDLDDGAGDAALGAFALSLLGGNQITLGHRHLIPGSYLAELSR